MNETQSNYEQNDYSINTDSPKSANRWPDGVHWAVESGADANCGLGKKYDHH